MKIGIFFKDRMLLLFAVAFLSASFFINQQNEKPLLFVPKQESTLNFNNSLLLHFNLGLKRIISSSLWISTILESDIEHYKAKDLNSWMFLRFNTISLLEPEFYENYAFGGPYLSIIKDDLEGASNLYKKGLTNYPQDYDLLKNASFHFYFEVKDLNTAYPFLQRLNSIPGKSPALVGALTRLQAEKGNLTDAMLMLDDLQKTYSPNSMFGKKIYEYRYSIKAEIDLTCLNSNSKSCSFTDLDGRPYLKNSDGFFAQKKWIPYRPKWHK